MGEFNNGTYIFTRTIERRPGPGEWKPLWDHDHWSATVACPQCKESATLLNHTIADTGKVSPSLVCPTLTDNVECPTCNYHVTALLNGWPELLSSQTPEH